MTERTTSVVSGAGPLDGIHSEPPRQRVIESDNHDWRPKQFGCEGDQLTITEPLNRLRMIQGSVPSMNLTRYPRSAVFVRQ